MRTILSLFSKSPFTPLQQHMEKVAVCVHQLEGLFEALQKREFEKILEIQKKISKQEHEADKEKNHIRNNLPKNLFMPISQSSLLEILSIQDSIADTSEDIAVLTTLKQLECLLNLDL